VDVADYRKQGAKLNFLPAVNFMGMYEQNTDSLDRFGGDSWTFMATASFNIFNGLGDRAGLVAASAEKQAAEEELRDTSARIELEVRQAFYSYQTALKQLEVTRAAVEQAGESVRILKNRYDNGMALMVELLAADTMLKDQQLQQARARFDALLAMARLELSAGVLGAGVKPVRGQESAPSDGGRGGAR
jgi:outer membrane protein TolC